jgi:hypothetical protein
MFTAFDVTKLLRSGGNTVKHYDVNDTIKKMFSNGDRLMEKVMIDEPVQWVQAQEKQKLKISTAPIYVNEVVVWQFVRYSINRAKMIGFAYGLGFSVFVATLVKLMGK